MFTAACLAVARQAVARRLIRPAVALPLLLAAGAQAAEPADLSPLLTDRAVATARLDLTQVKLRGVDDWVVDMMKRQGAPQPAIDQTHQGLSAVALIGQPVIDGLLRQGVREMAFVLHANDAPSKQPIFIIAFTKPANPAAATQLMAGLGVRSGQLGNLLVFSPNLPPGTLAKMKPAARPELTDPIADMAGHALVACGAFNDTIKAEMKTARPAGEDDVPPPDRFTGHIDLRSGPSAVARIHAASPEAAADLKSRLTGDLPPKRPLGQHAEVIGKIFKSVPMTVEGSDIVADLKQADFERITGQILDALPRNTTAPAR